VVVSLSSSLVSSSTHRQVRILTLGSHLDHTFDVFFDNCKALQVISARNPALIFRSPLAPHFDASFSAPHLSSTLPTWRQLSLTLQASHLSMTTAVNLSTSMLPPTMGAKSLTVAHELTAGYVSRLSFLTHALISFLDFLSWIQSQTYACLRGRVA
jgi:hypothetical protein